MASKYPGELDSLPTNKNNSTVAEDDHAPNHNDANDAINKIEAELGTNPSGSAETVAARLAALEGISSFAAAVYGEAWPERPDAEVVMWMGPKSAGDPEGRQDTDLRLEWEV